MPLIMVDIVKGRTAAEVGSLLDAVHDAVLGAFGVPAQDRYQIVTEHEPQHLVVQDTGLGIERSEAVILVRVLTRPRSREAKAGFYRLLTERLETRCGISPSDVVIALSVNDDEDWSFGFGRAQFLTGEL
ncbi:tautomerase family protein [Nguyenibacter vanlangensis]|uniref:Tautomerase family protein n=1 Tax=Nguyenibacter vanlangensis TaxID=1216886 RepID=A0A7Y7ISQ2_9PROT|nr:tautomerase family protein [Nguyenibacter vanlangensis]NVN09634.1 tautomerase family protein [Nguyenibacter vanlangensis]